MKAVEIFLTKLRPSRISTAMGLRMWLAVTGLTAIVRMAGIVAGVAGGPVVAGGIVDAAGAVDGLAAAGGIAGAAGLAEGDTKNSLPRIFADLHG